MFIRLCLSSPRPDLQYVLSKGCVSRRVCGRVGGWIDGPTDRRKGEKESGRMSECLA